MGDTKEGVCLIHSGAGENHRIWRGHATFSRQSNQDGYTHEDNFSQKASVPPSRSCANTHLESHNRPHTASERETEPTTVHIRPRYICSRTNTRPERRQVAISRRSRIPYFLQNGHIACPANIQTCKDAAPKGRSNTQQRYNRGFVKGGMADCAKE